MPEPLHFVWTTYAADGDCVVQSVRAVRRLAPEATLIVCDQRGAELRHPHRLALRDLGAAIAMGDYTRRDLYTDAIGRLRAILQAGDGWIHHLDSDTLLTTLAPAREVMASAAVAAAPAWPGHHFAGCSFLIRATAAATCLDDLLHRNSLRLPAAGIMDDDAIGRLLRAYYGEDRVTRWPLGTYLKRYRYRADPEPLAALGKYPAIHFGERRHARPLALGRPVRTVVAEHMRWLLDRTTTGE